MDYSMEELVKLVKELTDSYTGKESTSITYEAAQQLMGAVLYCIRENEMAAEYDEYTGSDIISQESLCGAKEAYDRGYRLVVDKVREANSIYNDIIMDFMDYGNRAYYDTLVKGMPEFFKWYDPRHNPADHIILLDYTVLERLNELEGADLIYRYLLCIRLEQKFLHKFPGEFIREVLVQYHSDYEELLINVCEVVLRRVLISMLIGADPLKPRFENPDYEKLYVIINNMSREELLKELNILLDELIADIYHEDMKLYNYLSNEIPNIAAELKNAANHNSLSNII